MVQTSPSDETNHVQPTPEPPDYSLTETLLENLVPNSTPTKVRKSLSERELRAMLESAKSIPYVSSEGRGLERVAKIAIREERYDIAMQAGTSAYSAPYQRDILTSVAISAANAGHFNLANAAASKIPYYDAESRVKNQILRIFEEASA